MSQKPKSSKSKTPKGFTVRPLPEESTTPIKGAGESGQAGQREPFEHLGELPHGYGMDTIFLIAQEPHWLFTYWDIDIARHPGGAAYLRCYLGDGTIEKEIEVPFETRNWYIPVGRPSTDYFVEIGFYRGKTWNLIARSVTVNTPPEGMATSESFDYATIPFHLSFQRLLDHLESASRSGEDLLSAVARLQREGDFSAFGAAGIPDLLTEDQRALLRVMLGADFLAELASGGLSSGEIESRIRLHLEEQLSSGAMGSEFLSSFRETVALFSGSFASGSELLSSAGQLSSETLAGSWEVAALSSWAAGAITSWSGSSEFSNIGGVTSWSLAGAAGASEVGASWAAALGSSWAQAALTSWSQAGSASWAVGAESSGALLAMSSWLQGVQSSWAQAALASWTSTEVSSWFSATAESSWSGGSETLSSFGAERGFFMHVNAEVIFYGGTDPRAKVTIDGHPVVLAPDGTFRYHFVFPNADHEISIVAESPDGVETRSAILRLDRNTQKVGVVTDTPQPPLGVPMGRRK